MEQKQQQKPSSRSSQRWRREYADERTHLLPPSGISTNEEADRNRSERSSGLGRSYYHESPESSRATERVNNTTAMAVYQFEVEQAERARRKKRRKKKKKKKRRQARRRNRELGRNDDSDVSSSSTSSDSSLEFNRWLDERSSFLEKEKARVVERWKAEARAEFEESRQRGSSKRRSQGSGAFRQLTKSVYKSLAYMESFFANLPLTIGAIALSTANLGVDWFKFMEENLESCQPVHFHSEQCTFPEVSYFAETRAKTQHVDSFLAASIVTRPMMRTR